MPRYTKNGGKHGYRKRYKPQNHEDIAKVVQNLSNREFRTLQEIAKHGMGYYTPFKDLLSPHPKQKVKPSSFEKYAAARSQSELAEEIIREKQEHDDHFSETHYGGGLQDAHNSIADWAFTLAMDHGSEFVSDWATDQLDPSTNEDHSDYVQQIVEPLVEAVGNYDVEENYIPNEDWINNILTNAPTQHENPVVEAVNWIGDILGTTKKVARI